MHLKFNSFTTKFITCPLTNLLFRLLIFPPIQSYGPDRKHMVIAFSLIATGTVQGISPAQSLPLETMPPPQGMSSSTPCDPSLTAVAD